MKKMIALILISFVLIVGCGNKSSDPNKSNESSPHKPMIEANATLNSAMSDSVSRLGDLSGFTQYYLVTDAYSEATKIFINEKTGKMAYAYAYLENNIPYIQRVYKYSLTEKSKNGIKIYLIDGGNKILVDETYYASYTFYDDAVISAEKKISKEDNGSGEWIVENGLPNVPMFLKNNGNTLEIIWMASQFPPQIDSKEYTLANEGSTFMDAVDTYKIN